MAVDVTDFVKDIHMREVLGIRFEQLILTLYVLILTPAIFFWLRHLRQRKFSFLVPDGCIHLGKQGESNVADEFEKKYETGTKDQSKWLIKALFVYPIKSCAATELKEADVEAEGFQYDRKFAFAEHRQTDGGGASGWVFRTLRQPGYEKLAHVKPEVWIPKKSDNAVSRNLRRVEREGCLIIKYPNVPTGALAFLDHFMLKWGLIPQENSFTIPLNPDADRKYPREPVKVWKDNPLWLNMGEHVPNDFKEWLGVTRPFTLFRTDPGSYRPVFGCAPRAEDVGFQPGIGFQDSYPIHLLGITSVRDVAKRLGYDAIEKLSIRRFRPNILIEGPDAYDEDSWKLCRIGGQDLFCSCRTTRCQLPNVDPDSAERHSTEPYKILNSYRRIDEGSPDKACLGMQLVPAQKACFRVRVGDRIEVLERGQHHYLAG